MSNKQLGVRERLSPESLSRVNVTMSSKFFPGVNEDRRLKKKSKFYERVQEIGDQFNKIKELKLHQRTKRKSKRVGKDFFLTPGFNVIY